VSIKRRAETIVDEAGQAGGVDEVRRLAELGWPENIALTDDSPELREAIKRAARETLDGPET
jgi:hypothetical protein